jgi:hypothetical protein
MVSSGHYSEEEAAVRDHERQLSPSEVAQTTANLRLAARFVRELVEHPELHEPLPGDGTIVLF